MPFKPNNKLSVGRPKGSINKRSMEFKHILEESGFCPVTALIEGHKLAMSRYVEELELVHSGRFSPMESEAAKYLKMALDCASDLTAYAYPKLKAIEQVKIDPLKDMSTRDRIDAMKQAVKFLESQEKAEKT